MNVSSRISPLRLVELYGIGGIMALRDSSSGRNSFKMLGKPTTVRYCKTMTMSLINKIEPMQIIPMRFQSCHRS